MLSRSSSSTLLAQQPFLPSISTLGPDPSYHHSASSSSVSPSTTTSSNKNTNHTPSYHPQQQQQQQQHHHHHHQHDHNQQQQPQQQHHHHHPIKPEEEQSYHHHYSFKHEDHHQHHHSPHSIYPFRHQPPSPHPHHPLHQNHQPMLSSPSLPNPHHQHQQHYQPHQHQFPAYHPHPHPAPPPLHLQQHPHHHQPNSHVLSRSLSLSTISGRPPPKTSRRQSKLNNLDRRRICEYAAAHPKSTQEDIALQWGIDRSSVSKILKYRDKWLSISPTARAAKVIKHRGGRFPQLESEVIRRCREKSLNGGFLGDRTIKDVALDVSQEMGLGEGAFKASNGWLDAFKERAQIKGGRFLDLTRSQSSMPIMNSGNQNRSTDPLDQSSNHLNPSHSSPCLGLINRSNKPDDDSNQLDHHHLKEIDHLEEGDEDEDDDDDDEEEEDEEDDDDEDDEDDDEDDDEEEQEEEEEEDYQFQDIDQHQPVRRNVGDASEKIEQADQTKQLVTDSDGQTDSPIQEHSSQHPTLVPTPPLSSSNSSFTSPEDGLQSVKMQDLADSLKSPVHDQRAVVPVGPAGEVPTSQSLSDTTTVNTHDRSSEGETDDPDPDGMDGVENTSSVIDSSSGDQTVIFKCPSSVRSARNYSNQQPLSTNPTQIRPFHHSIQNDHKAPSFTFRQASSTHSRSSSLSIGSLSQQSSVHGGDDHHLNSPARSSLKIHPGHQLSSYASHPNFHPPPLRTTPVRRTFPSLRHAISHPAFNSNSPGSSFTSSSSNQTPTLPPLSASSTSSQSHHQYASFPSHPYSFSPISAPPGHPTSHQPFSSRTNPRLELPPVCPSRVTHHSNHHLQREEAIEWPSDEYGVGFDEALGALETVMRFLQDQPTSFATPRDYMVVGELFGRMKEKKQEMMSIGVDNSQTTTSNPIKNHNSETASNLGLSMNLLPRRMMSSSSTTSLSNSALNNGIRTSSTAHHSSSPVISSGTQSQQQINLSSSSSPGNGLCLVQEVSQSDQMEQ